MFQFANDLKRRKTKKLQYTPTVHPLLFIGLQTNLVGGAVNCSVNWPIIYWNQASDKWAYPDLNSHPLAQLHGFAYRKHTICAYGSREFFAYGKHIARVSGKF